MADCQFLFSEAALDHSYCLSQCRFFVSAAADDLYLVAAFDAGSDDVHQALSVDVFAVDLFSFNLGNKRIVYNVILNESSLFSFFVNGLLEQSQHQHTNYGADNKS